MAMDAGHQLADDELKKLEKKLKKEYEQALKDMKAKADAYFDRFKKDDIRKREQLGAGKITQQAYDTWRMNHMLTGERYNRMIDSLAEDLTNANKIAMSMLNPALQKAYAENYNYGGYEIARGLNINISWELVDHNTIERLIKDNPKLLPKPRVDIPKDKRWNQQKLKSALTQGILQGDSINHIADRLQSVTDMSWNAAVRNARTATTGAENAGRQKSYEDAVEMGIPMDKQWVSTLDNRTRESHIRLDLETVDYNEKFSNGLMYPGDPNGAPEEVYNCRCTLIGRPRKREYKMDNRAEKLGNMSYEEWKLSKEPQGWTAEIKNILGKAEIGDDELRQMGAILAKEMQASKDKISDVQKELNDVYEVYKENNSKFENFRRASDQIHLEMNNNRKLDWDDNVYADLPKSRRDAIDYFINKTGTVVNIPDNTKIIDAINIIDGEGNKLVGIVNSSANKYNALRNDVITARKDYADVLRTKIGEIRPVGIGNLDIKNHYLGKSPMRTTVTEAYNYYPTEWIASSLNAGQLTVKKVQRGYYDHAGSEIAISGEGDRALSTAIHEVAHRFERTQNLREAETEFYERRTKGCKLEWLGSGYRRDEKTRKDDFINAYMGKDYSGNAFELCSMGFQYAFTDPLKLAKDADMEHWILGLLLGK